MARGALLEKGNEQLVLSTSESAVWIYALCNEMLCAGATGFILEIAWKEPGYSRFPVEG